MINTSYQQQLFLDQKNQGANNCKIKVNQTFAFWASYHYFNFRYLCVVSTSEALWLCFSRVHSYTGWIAEVRDLCGLAITTKEPGQHSQQRRLGQTLYKGNKKGSCAVMLHLLNSVFATKHNTRSEKLSCIPVVQTDPEGSTLIPELTNSWALQGQDHYVIKNYVKLRLTCFKACSLCFREMPPVCILTQGWV